MFWISQIASVAKATTTNEPVCSRRFIASVAKATTTNGLIDLPLI
jgi:hypothetical protein